VIAYSTIGFVLFRGAIKRVPQSAIGQQSR
jgi:hypothetical protein